MSDGPKTATRPGLHSRTMTGSISTRPDRPVVGDRDFLVLVSRAVAPAGRLVLHDGSAEHRHGRRRRVGLG